MKYIEPNRIVIKPNPANDNVSIEFNNENNKIFALTLSDANGRKIFYQGGIKEANTTINTGSFEMGSYYLSLSDSEGNVIKEKLIISK